MYETSLLDDLMRCRLNIIELLSTHMLISFENQLLRANRVHMIEAQKRFLPTELLMHLDYKDIASVQVGDCVTKTMTIIFADLRGFTSICERLEPKKIIELLNLLFYTLERWINVNGGFIETFSGDEIKAIFDGSTDAATRAGISMWAGLDEFNKHSAAMGYPEFRIGIGMNTGPVAIGIVGGGNRVQVTVLGDTVNIASRLEKLTKTYSARFLIGENSFLMLENPHAFAIRLVDRVTVTGKLSPINLYEIIDAEKPDRQRAKIETSALLQSALRNYFRRNFKESLEFFEMMKLYDPIDPVPALFAQRIMKYRYTATT